VGNLLGAGQPEKAKKSAVVAVIFASKYSVSLWFSIEAIDYELLLPAL